MLSIKFNAAGLLRGLDVIAQSAHEAVRPAAQAAAQVIYAEAKARVPTAGPHVGKGGKLYPGGALKRALYQAFSEDNSKPAGNGYARATYHVSWNARKAPHGQLIEFGHWQRYRVVKTRKGRFISIKAVPLAQPRWIAARPFLRPAYDAKKAAALQAAQAEFARRVR